MRIRLKIQIQPSMAGEGLLLQRPVHKSSLPKPRVSAIALEIVQFSGYFSPRKHSKCQYATSYCGYRFRLRFCGVWVWLFRSTVAWFMVSGFWVVAGLYDVSIVSIHTRLQRTLTVQVPYHHVLPRHLYYDY